MARRESSLSFQKDRSTLITGEKRGVGLAFVILVRSEIGDMEIKRDVYDLEEKGFHFSSSSLCPLFFFPHSFVLGVWFWFCSVGCVPELSLTVTIPLAHMLSEKRRIMSYGCSFLCTQRWNSGHRFWASACCSAELVHTLSKPQAAKLGSGGYLGACLYKLTKWRYPALKIGPEKHAWLLDSSIQGSLLYAKNICTCTLF